jgi:8-amino-7-oxononanoate synthase
MTNEISPWSYELENLKEKGLLRVMPEISGMPGRLIKVNGIDAVNFSGNNYLGLAGDPRVIKAGIDAALLCGAGSTASRLIAGNVEIYRGLEAFLSQWKRTESALVFGSGYQANLGILASLMEENDLIISDQLNHASIIDGCRLSKSEVRIYHHLDLDQVEDLLRLNGYRRKLVVTESVFSMDGDHAPLRDLNSLCGRWGASLMVDEAHSTGLFGPDGAGLAAEQGTIPEIQMGTLGKAVGVAGAYVAGSRNLIELLVNKARPLIYTTALPPATTGSVLQSLRIITSTEGNDLRQRLTENCAYFDELVSDLKRSLGRPTHIVPIVIGDCSHAMDVSAFCLRKGVFAQGIRFPTVPYGTARLRFTITAAHERHDLIKAAEVLREGLKRINSENDCCR